MGLADMAMKLKSEPKKEEKEPKDESSSELGVALDELFSLSGKDREAAFKLACRIAMGRGDSDDKAY